MTPKRGGQFRYLYRVTASSHPNIDVGKILVDKRRVLVNQWTFMDMETGDTWEVVGKRLNRLCTECHDVHKRATPIGHPGECGPDAPVVVPSDEAS